MTSGGPNGDRCRGLRSGVFVGAWIEAPLSMFKFLHDCRLRQGRHEELGLQNEDFEETAVEIQCAPYNPKPFHKHMMSPSSEATLRVTSMTLNGIWCEVVRTDQQPLLGTVAFIGRGDPFCAIETRANSPIQQ
uniref:hypothetical protein n=1 Tax=Neorhizobium sp. EC2-8 TaxID=3129230 RepID=UPI003100F782